jgi:putative transposase
MTIVRLVEKFSIDQRQEIYTAVDDASFAAKNLYNLVNYHIRQAYIHEHRYMKMGELWKIIKPTEAYQALPRKVSNQVIWHVYHDWGSYYEAIKVWRIAPEKFKARPRIPKYKPKQDGRILVTYEKGAINHKNFKKNGMVSPSGLNLPVQVGEGVQQLRIVPKKGQYVLEVVYEVNVPENPNLDKTLVAGMDIGVNNLAALTANKIGFQPKLVNGRPLKAINQYYNKKKAVIQSNLARSDSKKSSQNADDKRGKRFLSHEIIRMGIQRERRIENYLHTASIRIIKLLVKEKIGVLVIGHNKDWKQEANMGDKGNQNFVSIPFNKFIAQLTYKAHLNGIEVIQTEESYTSKCSFLDEEELCRHQKYIGRRVKRGLFLASTGQTINADLNGSYNVIRKVFPNAFRCSGTVGACAVHPSGFIL